MTEAKKLLARAQRAFAGHQLRDALQLCDRAALLSPQGRYEAAHLRGDILLSMGDAAGALSCYESVADVDVPDPVLDCARGQALFLLGRLAEAENALRSSLDSPVELAAAHHTLGLISELTRTREHVAHFRRARQLEPLRYPARAHLTTEQFRRAVDAAVATMEEPLRALLKEIPILVAYLPSVDDLAEHAPRLSPLALTMVVGVLEAKHQRSEDIDHVELGLLLYQRNFERQQIGEDGLATLLRETITQKLGEALGHDDELQEAEMVLTAINDDPEQS